MSDDVKAGLLGDNPSLERRDSIRLIKALFQLFSLADRMSCWFVRSWVYSRYRALVHAQRMCWKSWTSALRRMRASRAYLRKSNSCASPYLVLDKKILNGPLVRGRVSERRRMKIGTISSSSRKTSLLVLS